MWIAEKSRVILPRNHMENSWLLEMVQWKEQKEMRRKNNKVCAAALTMIIGIMAVLPGCGRQYGGKRFRLGCGAGGKYSTGRKRSAGWKYSSGRD